jgi:hypothetical protein
MEPSRRPRRTTAGSTGAQHPRSGLQPHDAAFVTITLRSNKEASDVD